MKSQNFKIAASVDKYGRKVKAEDGLGAMQDYYYTEENNDEVSTKQNFKEKNRKIKQKKKKVVPRIEQDEDEDEDNYNQE